MSGAKGGSRGRPPGRGKGGRSGPSKGDSRSSSAGGRGRPTGGGNAGKRSGGKGNAGRRPDDRPRSGNGPSKGGSTGGRGRSRSDSSEKTLGGDRVAGRQAVREALAGPRRVRELLLAVDLDPAPILDEINELASAEGVRVSRVGRSEVEAAAGIDAPQGVVAKLDPLDPQDPDVLARRSVEGRKPFLIVLDGVTDPGNLGAVLRSAEGAGATGIILPRHRSARVTATVAKTAAGAIEYLPIATVGGVPAALTRLRELGVWVVGLDQDGDQPLWDLAVADEPIALVLGAEGTGLSRLARERCDTVVAVPQLGHLDSLNVSAAAAVACFEVARRRA
jgi:23S rRNA (guanosine2251-2'-O)-methyltransferase